MSTIKKKKDLAFLIFHNNMEALEKIEGIEKKKLQIPPPIIKKIENRQSSPVSRDSSKEIRDATQFFSNMGLYLGRVYISQMGEECSRLIHTNGFGRKNKINFVQSFFNVCTYNPLSQSIPNTSLTSREKGADFNDLVVYLEKAPKDEYEDIIVKIYKDWRGIKHGMS